MQIGGLWYFGSCPRIAPQTQVAIAPRVEHLFHWPVLLLLLALAALGAANAVRPWWTRRRAALRLALDAACLLVSGLLFAAGPWFTITTSAPPEPAARTMHHAGLLLLTGLALYFLVRGLGDARRAFGRQSARD